MWVFVEFFVTVPDSLYFQILRVEMIMWVFAEFDL